MSKNIYGDAPTRGRTLSHVANLYDILSPLMTFYQEKRLSLKAIKLMSLRKGNRVLDIGCGTGTVTLDIARQLDHLGGGAKVIGIDAAAKMIEKAQDKLDGHSNVDFVVAAAENLDYPDNSFDSIISTFFFHHIDYTLKCQTLTNIYRILKEGGKAIIVDVDVPSNCFGKFCAWAGYYLFRQNEIKENIEAKLRKAIESTAFKNYKIISHHLGYISIFELVK